MEWAMMIGFGVLCSVTDCIRRKIPGSILLLGALCGVIATGIGLMQGSRSWYDAVLAVMPGIILCCFSLAAEGKIGRGDGDMVLIMGLLLGWELCIAVLCTACLITAMFAGAGMAMGKLRKQSRIPFAPFLLAAAVLIRCGTLIW